MQENKKNNNPDEIEEHIEFEVSSGNIYADLGLSEPEDRQAKSQLMHFINGEIKRLGLNQSAAAARVGLSQSDVSRIACAKCSTFSTDRLLDVIRHLGGDVEITLHTGSGPVGRYRVRELV